MSVVQKGNKADGDIVAGSKTVYVNQVTPTPLSRLYQILRDDQQASSHKSVIGEILQHFRTATTNDVRGLEEKLKDGDRIDVLDSAKFWKQRAAMLIMEWQTSPVTQDIITHILSKIYAEFDLHARPAIQAGSSRAVVDQLISEKVLAPTSEMLGENDLQITVSDLLGMLYYLGGNCHIRWDKC